MGARQGQVPHAHHRLHGVRLVHHDQPARGRRRLDEARHRQVAPLPVAEDAADAGQRLVRGHVADDGQDRVVGDVVRAVERRQVGAADALQRGGRAVHRPAVRVPAVDELAEDDAGHVARIVLADLHARQQLAAVALDLGRVVGRPARDVGQQVEGEVEVVLQHQDVDEAQVAPGAHGEAAADVVDGRGQLLRAAAGRALVEQLGGHGGDAGQLVRVVRRAGADQQADVHDGLLVRAHHHHLQAVVEPLELVLREVHLGREQRRRRGLGRPVGDLRRRGGRRAGQRQSQSQRRQHGGGRTAPRPRAPTGHRDATPRLGRRKPREPRGRMVSTSRLSSRK